MDLASYKTLTGLTVLASNEALVNANILKSQYKLEAMLGFALSPQTKVVENYYNELGISPNECSCSIVDTENLLAPDAVVKSYRLYRYNPLNEYIHIDPCSSVNEMKLVVIRKGTGNTGITIKKFTEDEYRLQYSGDVCRYVQPIHCNCSTICENEQVQVAVDANWLWEDDTEIPKNILYIWADMVTYYSDKKRDIKSESIESHSYSKDALKAPETLGDNMKVLQAYVGPYGKLGQS